MDSIALIILNYNSYDDTVNCVEHLIAFNESCRIIIVDNCSPDGSGDKLVERYGDTAGVDVLISDTNRGYGAGNNIGIRYAADRYRPRFIGILNPDVVIPEKQVLIRMKEILDTHPECGMVGAVIDDGSATPNYNYSAWPITSVGRFVCKQSLFTGRYRRPFEGRKLGDELYKVDCVAGCFFIARMSCMEKIGFFDENVFLYNEEDILGFKFKKAGYDVCLASDLRYFHNHKRASTEGETLSSKVRATGASYDSAAYVCRTYYEGKGLIRLFLIEMINRVYLFCAFIKNRLTGK